MGLDQKSTIADAAPASVPASTISKLTGLPVPEVTKELLVAPQRLTESIPPPPTPVPAPQYPPTHVGHTALQTLQSYLRQPVMSSFIAGGMAGAISRTVVSPLERMKILFQVQGPGTQVYNGVGSALAKMWRDEGWRGLMRGNGTNCVRIVPYSAVQFSSYTVYKRLLTDPASGDMGTLRRLVAGALAGVTSVVATYPLDITRTRLSIQSASFATLGDVGHVKHPPGMWATMRSMYRSEGGVVALYRGLGPTLAGVAPYVGINFATYEAMRKVMTPEGETNPGVLGKLFAGGVSGAVAQSITYPFDVLRRRFQVNTMTGLGYQYEGLWDAITIIVRVAALTTCLGKMVPDETGITIYQILIGSILYANMVT